MKRLFLIKEGSDLTPLLMVDPNQHHIPKKKRGIIKAGTDLVLTIKKGVPHIQRADIRIPYRHMVFTFNVQNWEKNVRPMEISALSTQGFPTDQVDGLTWIPPEISKVGDVNKDTVELNEVDVYSSPVSKFGKV